MTIMVTIFLTCFGLLIIGASVDGVFNDSNQSSFSEAVAFFAAAIAVVLLIAIITIGFYMGDIKEWFG